MTKVLTIDAIEASASAVFCREGFDRASLREIANHAGVSLSAIHEYFDSKAALYVHIGKVLFDRIEGERHGRLEAMRANGPIALENVIHALVAPIILTAQDWQEDGWTPSKLRTWYETTRYLGNHPRFRVELREATERWVEAIRESCPGLTHENGLLAYSLVASTILTWDATDHYMQETLDLSGKRPPPEICDLMVRFLVAGIRNLN